ncbi:hypothetical protein RJ639_038677 [Escallonia herrerae]|uniref:Uncharacterized protein n=1 Tax=Escallonia herrerae TaxID=1293975 RepID=A0AA88RVB8_9ASTE|nr:hypothetical protein RJ639_024824 [Escallonia herrerae]KAK3029880.1 hypothetical protein RJ639_038677 [Escallonia herrerae]
MAAVFKAFVAALLLTCLAREGFCEECSLDTINILTERTGVEIQGKPEWKVTVYNHCKCRQGGIVLSCPDFQTVEPVDPNVVARSADGRCLILNGNSLAPSATVTFKYAWDPPFLLLPRQSTSFC